MHGVTIRVSGQVQGVNFRTAVKGVAEELCLAGLVRNDPDGSVHIEAEGEESQIEKLIAWCHEGTEYSKVNEVKVERRPLRDFEGFKID